MKLLITDYLYESKKLGIDPIKITQVIESHSNPKSLYLTAEQVIVITDILLPHAVSTRYDVDSFKRGIQEESHRTKYEPVYMRYVISL